MVGKIKKKGLTRISAYANPEELTAMATDAQKAGFRRVGIPTTKKKPHGFAEEKEANKWPEERREGVREMLERFWYWIAPKICGLMFALGYREKPFKKIYCHVCKKMIVKPKAGGVVVGCSDGKLRCVNCYSIFEGNKANRRG